MKYIFGIILLILFSNLSIAASWSGDLTVEKIFTEGSTDLIVAYTSGGSVYATGCLANNWIFKADTEDRRNRAYSTLMAALASGKKIQFWYSDVCSSWSYHEATSIVIVK